MNKKKKSTDLAKVHCAHSSAVGVDVHSKELVCCYQRYDPGSGDLFEEHARFKTVGDGPEEFSRWCLVRSPDITLMESTGIFWFSPYEALEDVGMTQSQIAVVRADRVKGPKGRKTDKYDAVRLTEYARMGAYKASFIPPRDFRHARQVGRVFHRAKQDAATATNRLHKQFSAMGCRLNLVFSDIRGKTASKIIDAYLSGDPEKFKETVRKSRRLKAGPEEIMAAFREEIDPAKLRLLLALKQETERRKAFANECLQELERVLAPYQHLVDLFISIPGVQRVSALKILSELAPTLEAFPTVRHFCSWIGICPGNNESAGKRGSGRIPKGNSYLKTYLVEVGQAVGLMKIQDTEVRKFFQSVKERRGHRRAVVAVGHKIARIIYALYRTGCAYEEVTDHTLLRVRRARLDRAARGLKELGENVVVSTGIAEPDGANNAGDRGKVTRIIAAGHQSEEPVPKLA